MSTEPKPKSGYAVFLGSILASFLATVGGLLVEYKSGYFQTQKLERAARENNDESPVPPQPQRQSNNNQNNNQTRQPNPSFPSSPGKGSFDAANVEPSIVEEDIGTVYKKFRAYPEPAKREYAEGKILRVTADVRLNRLMVSSDYQPFVLALDSDQGPLLCFFMMKILLQA